MKTLPSRPLSVLAAALCCACFLPFSGVRAAFLLMPEGGDSLDPALKEAYAAFKNESYAQAVELFRKEALKSNAAAQFALGILYQEGKGVPRSVANAIGWYQKGAAAGHEPSQYNLALLLLEDASTRDKGISWLKTAAENGSTKAKLSLGNLYLSGKGVKQDVQESRRWIESAYKDGNKEAAFVLGRLEESGALKEGGNQEKALELFQEAAQSGHLAAALHLADKYTKGNGIERDIGKAVKWFRFAADDLKSPRGQLGLGELYEAGLTGEKDYAQALEWFRKAAASGEALGFNKIAYFHENGLGVEKNLSKAVENYTKAAEAGLTVAMYNMAVFYNKGTGVEKDASKAAEWLYRAAAGGLPIAQNELAVHYRDGKGVMRDYLAALTWFDSAAKSGFVGAMVNLAMMHAEGMGTRRNFQMAARFFDLAAQRGDVFSHLQLANMLRVGLGVEKNPVKAWALVLNVKQIQNLKPQLAEMLSDTEKELSAVMTDEQKAEAKKLLESKPGAATGAAPAGKE